MATVALVLFIPIWNSLTTLTHALPTGRKLLDLNGIKNFQLPIIFVLGGPGAGKASLCYQFRAHYGISYLSVGTLLRQEAGEPTARGREIAKYVHQLPAQRVPMDLVLLVLKENLVKVVAANRSVFVQGFPRDLEQAARYEDEVAPIRHVLHVNTSEETSKRRLVQRNKLAARFEDNSCIIQLRRNAFLDEVLPVIDNLRNTDRVRELNGNADMRSVFDKAKTIFRYWAHKCKKQHEPKIMTPVSRLEYGSALKRPLTKLETDTEKSFPSVDYHGPICNGHY